ncbi:MAG: metal-dependent hydrolase [Candidatus Binataceae bacterium]
MKVRKPHYDYTSSLPRWCKAYPEYSHVINVASLMLPYLEPYLNTVMRRAQAQLGPSHPLNADISLFCKQEAAHYLNHGEYNDALRKAGYPRLPEFEEQFRKHFDRLLNEKSLRYNCAYSLAFESIGPVYAEWWFGGADDIMQDADPSVVALWRWHLAEEFEHRNVAYDVYQSLFGGYFYRIYAQYEFMRDLRVLTRGAVKYLLTEDSRQMNAEEQNQSRQRFAEIRKRESSFITKRLMRVLSPVYTPHTLREPKGIAELLAKVDAAA